MYSLLHFITRYSAIILFILFEAISFYLIVNYNQDQRSQFLSSSNQFSGFVSGKRANLYGYLGLQKELDRLQEENSRLKEELFNQPKMNTQAADSLASTSPIRYKLESAQVISNSIDQRINFMTISKGLNEGLNEGMGVVHNDAVIGVIEKCNNRYCQILSILSENCNISSRLESSGAFGNIEWEPWDTRYVYLKNIPKHVEVEIGEKVSTSGYSLIFPEGISIGVVEQIEEERGSNEHRIRVQLNADLIRVRRVDIVQFETKPSFDE